MLSNVQLSASTNTRLMAYAATAGAALVVPSMAEAAVVTVTPATPIAITDSIDGVYFNVVTGVTGASSAAVPGYDINPYNNGGGLTFYGNATPQGILATGTAGTTAVAQLLTPGSVVSATPAVGFYNQFQTIGSLFTATSGTKFVGFRFTNETTGILNYGYLAVSTTAGTGFPATITSYGYENTGAAITIPGVPEPTSLGLAGLAVGALAKRHRRAV